MQKDYEFSSPVEAGEWRAYHDIRRRVLFEARGEPYDENHPDEHASGNYPKLLKHRGPRRLGRDMLIRVL